MNALVGYKGKLIFSSVFFAIASESSKLGQVLRLSILFLSLYPTNKNVSIASKNSINRLKKNTLVKRGRETSMLQEQNRKSLITIYNFTFYCLLVLL